MWISRRIFVCLTTLIASSISTLPGGEVATITGPTMGTSYTVSWTQIDQISTSEVKDRVNQRLTELNSMMSTYDPNSELSRFNSSDSTDWFLVSPETALVVAKALEIHHLSGGAFDPTVKRLVGLWSFGADRRTYEPPADADIDAARRSMGAGEVEVRKDPPALLKHRPEIQLDLSAIAKGYGVDDLAALLQSLGINNAMVEIGGEVRTQGDKLGQPWTIGIERPSALPSGLSATIRLRDQALATSGDYRNFYEQDGVRYSHTIDPATGRPVTHTLASASVVAEDCMTADALATALMVLGPERGLHFAEEQGLAVYLLTHVPGGGFVESASTVGRELFHPVIADATPRVPVAGPGLLGTVVLTIAIFGLAIAGLAVGVIFSNRRLKGSCGGASGLKDEQGRPICGMCTTPPEECDRRRQELIDQTRPEA